MVTIRHVVQTGQRCVQLRRVGLGVGVHRRRVYRWRLWWRRVRWWRRWVPGDYGLQRWHEFRLPLLVLRGRMGGFHHGFNHRLGGFCLGCPFGGEVHRKGAFPAPTRGCWRRHRHTRTRKSSIKSIPRCGVRHTRTGESPVRSIPRCGRTGVESAIVST